MFRCVLYFLRNEYFSSFVYKVSKMLVSIHEIHLFVFQNEDLFQFLCYCRLIFMRYCVYYLTLYMNDTELVCSTGKGCTYCVLYLIILVVFHEQFTLMKRQRAPLFQIFLSDILRNTKDRDKAFLLSLNSYS
jgi:hypothetical protein